MHLYVKMAFALKVAIILVSKRNIVVSVIASFIGFAWASTSPHHFLCSLDIKVITR